jgi:tetratricopeptide (TPR) repeat protein
MLERFEKRLVTACAVAFVLAANVVLAAGPDPAKAPLMKQLNLKGVGALFIEKNCKSAIAAFAETVRVDPGDTNSWHFLAIALEQDGQGLKAIAVWDVMLGLEETIEMASGMVGYQTSCAQKSISDMSGKIEKLGDAEPATAAELLGERAMMQVVLQDWKAAEDDIRTALERAPSARRAQLARAMLAIENGAWPTADAALTLALKDAKEDAVVQDLVEMIRIAHSRKAWRQDRLKISIARAGELKKSKEEIAKLVAERKALPVVPDDDVQAMVDVTLRGLRIDPKDRAPYLAMVEAANAARAAMPAEEAMAASEKALELARSGNLDRAVVMLDTAAAARPDLFEVQMAQAEVFSLAGRFDDASRSAAYAVKIDPKSVAACVRYAKTLAASRSKYAESAAEEEIALLPGADDPDYQQGLAQYKEKKLDDAFETFVKLVREHPDHVPAKFAIAKIRFDLKQYKTGRQELLEAQELAPDCYVIQLKLADALLLRDEYVDAADEYETLIKADPTDIAARTGRAVCLIKDQKLVDACAELDQCIRLVPKDYLLLRYRAYCRLAAGNVDAALQDAEDGLRINETDDWTILLHDEAYIRSGKGDFRESGLKDIVKECQQMQSRNPSFARSYYVMACAYDGLQQRDKAIEAIAKGKELDPNLPIPDDSYRPRTPEEIAANKETWRKFEAAQHADQDRQAQSAPPKRDWIDELAEATHNMATGGDTSARDAGNANDARGAELQQRMDNERHMNDRIHEIERKFSK